LRILIILGEAISRSRRQEDRNISLKPRTLFEQHCVITRKTEFIGSWFRFMDTFFIFLYISFRSW
jgi:hypothetical protein